MATKSSFVVNSEKTHRAPLAGHFSRSRGKNRGDCAKFHGQCMMQIIPADALYCLIDNRLGMKCEHTTVCGTNYTIITSV